MLVRQSYANLTPNPQQFNLCVCDYILAQNLSKAVESACMSVVFRLESACVCVCMFITHMCVSLVSFCQIQKQADFLFFFFKLKPRFSSVVPLLETFQQKPLLLCDILHAHIIYRVNEYKPIKHYWLTSLNITNSNRWHLIIKQSPVT